MKRYFLILGILTVSGCSNATRTVYVPVLEERTVSGEIVEHKKLVVPENHYYLPPPRRIDSVELPPPRKMYTEEYSFKSERLLVPPKDVRTIPLNRHCDDSHSIECYK